MRYDPESGIDWNQDWLVPWQSSTGYPELPRCLYAVGYEGNPWGLPEAPLPINGRIDIELEGGDPPSVDVRCGTPYGLTPYDGYADWVKVYPGQTQIDCAPIGAGFVMIYHDNYLVSWVPYGVDATVEILLP